MSVDNTPSPVRLKAVAAPGQPDPSPELEQLYRGFEQELLVPLWTEIGDLMKAMRPLPPGSRVEVRALDPGAPIDIPAWCRMVGHELLVRAGGPDHVHYLIRKGGSS